MISLNKKFSRITVPYNLYLLTKICFSLMYVFCLMNKDYHTWMESH